LAVEDRDVGRRVMQMSEGLWSISWWTGVGAKERMESDVRTDA